MYINPNYRVISGRDLTDLAENVDKLLHEGWECQGGIAMAAEIGCTLVWWAQAMVRSEPQPAVVAPTREHNPAAD